MPPGFALTLSQISKVSKTKRAVPSPMKRGGSYNFGLYQDRPTGKIREFPWSVKNPKVARGVGPMFLVRFLSFLCSAAL